MMKNTLPIENEIPKYKKRKKMRSLKSLSKKQLHDKQTQAFKNIVSDYEWLSRCKTRKSQLFNVFADTALRGIEKNAGRLDNILKVLLDETD